jgi:hypothetical protein
VALAALASIEGLMFDLIGSFFSSPGSLSASATVCARVRNLGGNAAGNLDGRD